MKKNKVAFLGLGVMGYPMAGHLARAGYDVTVYNRTTQKAERWAKDHAGNFHADIEGAIAQAEMIFCCVGDDPDVRAVADKVVPNLMAGAVLVDHTTASPQLAREIAGEVAAKGAQFIDAPVSGGEAGAINGALSVMCGGEAAAIEQCRPVMEAYAGRIVHIGPSGHGQLCKAVNQICIAGILQGLSEGVHFAQQADLDIDRVLEAISGGAAQSWQMENRTKTMADDQFDFGFAVDWMRKDLRIALNEARQTDARLPMTAMVDQYYGDIQSMDGGRWDTSSLLRRLTRVKP